MRDLLEWLEVALGLAGLAVGLRALGRIRRHEDGDSLWQRAKRLGRRA